jgi:hypothetical protein
VVICDSRQCKKLDGQKYPVKIVDWSEEKQREFIIKDNVGFGEWDWDELANTWNAEELNEWGLDTPDNWGGEELEAEEDDYEMPEELKTDVVLGDLNRDRRTPFTLWR